MGNVINYTLDDLKEFSDICKSRSRRLLGKNGIDVLISFILWMFIAIGFLSAASFYSSASEYRDDMLIILAYIAIVASLIWLFRWRKINRYKNLMYSKDGAFLTEKRIELGNEYIIFTSKYSEQKYKYEAVLDYVVGERNIYLFIDPFQALFIPRSICDEQFIKSKLSVRS